MHACIGYCIKSYFCLVWSVDGTLVLICDNICSDGLSTTEGAKPSDLKNILGLANSQGSLLNMFLWSIKKQIHSTSCSALQRVMDRWIIRWKIVHVHEWTALKLTSTFASLHCAIWWWFAASQRYVTKTGMSQSAGWPGNCCQTSVATCEPLHDVGVGVAQTASLQQCHSVDRPRQIHCSEATTWHPSCLPYH